MSAHSWDPLKGPAEGVLTDKAVPDPPCLTGRPGDTTRSAGPPTPHVYSRDLRNSGPSAHSHASQDGPSRPWEFGVTYPRFL